MKLIHLSDLHFGKRVHEFSMIEDQKHIMGEILTIIEAEKPDGVLVAGDVYDRSIPSEDAMRLWDEFLLKIVEMKVPAYVIGGNHDSMVRLSDHNELIEHTGIHIASEYDGTVKAHTLSDEYGEVKIYLLPFIKPAVVKNVLMKDPEKADAAEQIKTYTDAVKAAVDAMKVDPAKRNVLVAHQYFAGSEKCDSEEITIGGLDEVDVAAVDVFDYVALGHLHGPQSVGRETVRYCGTPLKYSFSERSHTKSVTIVEIGKKENSDVDIVIRTAPLTPLHDLREVRGLFDDVTDPANYAGADREDYVHVVLTDEEDIPNAINKLHNVYPNLMKLSYDNKRTRGTAVIGMADGVERKSPLELFEELYLAQNGSGMSEKQKELVQGLVEDIWK